MGNGGMGLEIPLRCGYGVWDLTLLYGTQACMMNLSIALVKKPARGRRATRQRKKLVNTEQFFIHSRPNPIYSLPEEKKKPVMPLKSPPLKTLLLHLHSPNVRLPLLHLAQRLLQLQMLLLL